MVLIPARNEGHSIAALVRESLHITQKPVVVINDCSTDDTAAQARAAGAIVLDLPVRLGAWGATQTGLRYAASKGWPLAVTLDADGQHEASRIHALTARICDDQADVVIGACPERASLLRRLAWRYLRWLADINLADITSGFRAYGRAAIERLAEADATLLDYQDVGVLMILNRQGLRIHEVPVPMNPRLHGHSRVFDTWWTVAGYMMKTSVLCIARIGQGPTGSRSARDPIGRSDQG